MKFVISAARGDRNESWIGHIGNDKVSACPSDVGVGPILSALDVQFEDDLTADGQFGMVS